MPTWLNPRNGVIHAIAEDGQKTICGFVRLWITRGRIDPAGRFTEEYRQEVMEELGGPWALCCHCRERGGGDGLPTGRQG